MVAVVLCNNLLFLTLTGKFSFLLDAIRDRQASGYLEETGATSTLRQALSYYPSYFFAKPYHMWLAGYLGVVWLAAWRLRRRTACVVDRFNVGFVVWWGLGLVLLFSLFVVSWRPLLFIPKQTYDMLMFAAPVSLLAGYGMAQFKGRSLWVVIALVVLPSIVLSAMQQSSIRAFTANSKAAVEFAREHPHSAIFSTSNPYRAAKFNNLVNPAAPVVIRSIEELAEPVTSPMADVDRYVIIDTETLQWGGKEPIRRLSEAPACWIPAGQLDSHVAGAGPRLVSTLARAAATLPEPLWRRLAPKFQELTRPSAAYLFRVPEGCRFRAAGSLVRGP